MSSITSLYGLFSNLDILGINSIHYGPHRVNHGGLFQEDINYGEIHFILQLARNSGLLKHRPENLVPRVFHGAREPLEVPASGRWEDTRPVRSEASEAILAAARGLRPTIHLGSASRTMHERGQCDSSSTGRRVGPEEPDQSWLVRGAVRSMCTSKVSTDRTIPGGCM